LVFQDHIRQNAGRLRDFSASTPNFGLFWGQKNDEMNFKTSEVVGTLQMTLDDDEKRTLRQLFSRLQQFVKRHLCLRTRLNDHPRL